MRFSLAISVCVCVCCKGVDPVARREIWQLISDMVSDEKVELKDRTSVVLTTHSMEECEALW